MKTPRHRCLCFVGKVVNLHRQIYVKHSFFKQGVFLPASGQDLKWVIWLAFTYYFTMGLSFSCCLSFGRPRKGKNVHFWGFVAQLSTNSLGPHLLMPNEPCKWRGPCPEPLMPDWEPDHAHSFTESPWASVCTFPHSTNFLYHCTCLQVLNKKWCLKCAIKTHLLSSVYLFFLKFSKMKMN